MWKLRNFTDTERNGIVPKWLREQTPELRAQFLVRMRDLVKQPANGWDRPDVGQLRHGDCRGLFEIVLTANNVQHRPIGYFSGKQEFTFLAFATEKDNKLLPKGICKVAKQRQNLIEDEPDVRKKRVRDIILQK